MNLVTGVNYRLCGKFGDTLARVGYVIVNGVLVTNNAFHTKGDENPKLDNGTPTFPVIAELARIVVSQDTQQHKRRVKFRLVKEILDSDNPGRVQYEPER